MAKTAGKSQILQGWLVPWWHVWQAHELKWAGQQIQEMGESIWRREGRVWHILWGTTQK
jgi:hypothetical protein